MPDSPSLIVTADKLLLLSKNVENLPMYELFSTVWKIMAPRTKRGERERMSFCSGTRVVCFEVPGATKMSLIEVPWSRRV